MTASAPVQPRPGRRQRPIIDRPRLIKLLDQTSAKTVLLFAPAGYGKTTLARQWAKTLQRPVWVSHAPAHRDVAALAHDFAAAIDAAGGEASSLISEHIKAQTNPQRAARELGRVLVSCLESARAQWLILDEYEDLEGADGAEQLIETVATESEVRILITSRVRPGWSTGRGLVYGQLEEIGQTELAMTEDEVARVLKPNRAGAWIAERANGWPAVVGLAAAVEPESAPIDTLPDALHRYLAEELYQRASEGLQGQLVTLALLSDTSQRALEARFGEEARPIVAEATDLGFGSGDPAFELHPLLRDFLLGKLAEDPDAESRIEEAIAAHLSAEAWERAFELIVRFKRWCDIDRALRVALKPLVRSGRLETLATFVSAIELTESFPLPSVEVVLGELAHRDGQLELAKAHLLRAEPKLESSHPLRSHAAALRGHANYFLADFPAATAAYRTARAFAVDERDEGEAVYGLALAASAGEEDEADEAVAELAQRRDNSPLDLARFVAADIFQGRVGGEISGLKGLAIARHALGHIGDPRARSGMSYAVAYGLALCARYDEAREWIELAAWDVDEFSLKFAKPLVNWVAGQIALGQRRYGAVERLLQLVEDAAAQEQLGYHIANARMLRARLLLQNGDIEKGYECVHPAPPASLSGAWAGEYLGTRAVALSCLGAADEAFATASRTDSASTAADVRLLAQTARAIASAGQTIEAGVRLIQMAELSSAWDPIVCGLRSSPALAAELARIPETRPALAGLYQQTQDSALARRAGLRTRATGSPHALLSPRELEVLGLIARGYRNQDIAKALYIAESTTKVHIRHIFEKLGVRTRAGAVARLEMLENLNSPTG